MTTSQGSTLSLCLCSLQKQSPFWPSHSSPLKSNNEMGYRGRGDTQKPQRALPAKTYFSSHSSCSFQVTSLFLLAPATLHDTSKSPSCVTGLSGGVGGILGSSVMGESVLHSCKSKIRILPLATYGCLRFHLSYFLGSAWPIVNELVQTVIPSDLITIVWK